MNESRLDVPFKVIEKLLNLLLLPSVLAAQHGDGEFAELLRLSFDGKTAHPVQEPSTIEQAIYKPRSPAKQCRCLFQVDIDAPEKNLAFANVVFVGAERRVRGNQNCVMSLSLQRSHQSVVAHAIPAKHSRGA